MEQSDLINQAARIINQASERDGAGFPDQAKAKLAELWELLNLARADQQSADEKMEATLGGDKVE